ncbi:DUF2238 domain-containing protein [Thalassoglobus sp. JC818]|uniref:DUF2238 domain-containing protein n=1 Tax=Thalassoglobus sp. JC818 TaxID=3232136 RepID=UPI00345A90E1
MRGLLSNEKTILLVTMLYIAPALWNSFASGKMEFVIYVGVMGVLLGPVLWLHHQVRLHPLALWGLSLWGFAHMCGGLVHVPESWPTEGTSSVLYNLWLIPHRLKYDQLVHAYGFGLTTWICWQALKAAFQKSGVSVSPTFGLLTLCAAAGMGFGALNEVVEFAATLLVPETNVGGYINTGWDLVSNLVGCLIAAVLISLFDRRSQVRPS